MYKKTYSIFSIIMCLVCYISMFSISDCLLKILEKEYNKGVLSAIVVVETILVVLHLIKNICLSKGYYFLISDGFYALVFMFIAYYLFKNGLCVEIVAMYCTYVSFLFLYRSLRLHTSEAIMGSKITLVIYNRHPKDAFICNSNNTWGDMFEEKDFTEEKEGLNVKE